MRTDNDLLIVNNPSWVTTRSLLALILVLLLVIAVGAAGLVRARMIQQEAQETAERNEKAATLERLRSRILEDINGACPLSEVLEQITGMVAFKLDGAHCWIQVPEEHWGAQPVERYASRILHREIPGRAGTPLGMLYVALDWRTIPSAEEAEALAAGAGLASLAIETRKLYLDLFRRSEFDLLTNLHNRYSLDKKLASRIGGARQNAAVFGLIYIDLDKFKEINDLYGHRIGDLYLCAVAQRMAAQLRSVDMLARLGGDEFAALTPEVHCRADVQEIAVRLERCFETPFIIEGHSLTGSASMGISLYPEDGTDKDTLFNAADAAMYEIKHERRQVALEEMAE
jgi:diguanylate cyclase (GGDEF)-like protein